MKKAPPILRQMYLEGVARYLEHGDENTLSAAYEIGRRALQDDVGLLELVSIHHEALHALASSEPLRADIAKAAEDFQREVLSPYEMALRGYREANAQLQRMNVMLAREKANVEETNRELEAFSYSVSHDLRAPLRTVSGFAQALREQYEEKLDGDARRYLAYVSEGARRMDELIDALLSLARVARGEITRASVDLSAIARRVTAQLRAREPSRQVDVDIEDGLVAEGDGRLLAIVLENLLDNAWKYTAKRSPARISFASAQHDGHGCFVVRDDGAGFDTKYADRLFVPFQRLHPSSEFEGTGIGLATVHRIVRKHGGRVWAEAKVGEGASFFFTLGRV